MLGSAALGLGHLVSLLFLVELMRAEREVSWHPTTRVKLTVSGSCDKISWSAQARRATPSAVPLRSTPLRERPGPAAAGRAQFLSHYPYCLSVKCFSPLVHVRRVSEKHRWLGGLDRDTDILFYHPFRWNEPNGVILRFSEYVSISLNKYKILNNHSSVNGNMSRLWCLTKMLRFDSVVAFVSSL